jgi:hypothetical protein
MIPPQTHKRCTRCGDWLPRSLFRPNPKIRSGLSSWCKPCQLERTQQWRAEHRDELNARRREQYGSTHPHNYAANRASPQKIA